MRKLDPREGQGPAQSHTHTAMGSKTLRRHYSQRRNENGACYKEIGSQRKGRHTTPFIRNLIHTQLWKNDMSIGCFFCSLDLFLLPLLYLLPSGASPLLLCVHSGRSCQSKGPSLHWTRSGHVTQTQPIIFPPEILEQIRQRRRKAGSASPRKWPPEGC